MKNVLCILIFLAVQAQSNAETTEHFDLKRLHWYGSRVYVQKEEDRQFIRMVRDLSVDVIKDSDYRMKRLLALQSRAQGCAAYEVGFLTYVLTEKYRAMVDKYNTSVMMGPLLYLSELVIYLEEIEKHYWDLQHIANMLHEVERKYGVAPDLLTTETLRNATKSSGAWPVNATLIMPPRRTTTRRTKIDPKAVFPPTRPTGRYRTKKNRWWDWDYGWEPEQQWFPDDWPYIWRTTESPTKSD